MGRDCGEFSSQGVIGTLPDRRGSVLKGHNFRKAESHCSRITKVDRKNEKNSETR